MPLTCFEAKHIAEDFGLFGRDFHSAKECGYRKPKNANGSTARYFAAYVVKKATLPMSVR